MSAMRLWDAIVRKRAMDPIQVFVDRGRKPWSQGYRAYKEDAIAKVLVDERLRAAMREGGNLPPGYGSRIDERIVEIPWLFARLPSAGILLDAGSALRYDYLLDRPELSRLAYVSYNLALEIDRIRPRANVSSMYGDLRSTLLRDACVDAVACISTLEHVGMDNAFLYSGDPAHREAATADYLAVIREFRRILRPGGRLFLTVPVGVAEQLGWLQQFDEAMLDGIVTVFGGACVAKHWYQYRDDQWVRSDALSCRECRYHDINTATCEAPDHAAAARAVACMELVRGGESA